MGWSKGKGLGREEQGDVEPVRLSYKHDSKGMGYKGHGDEWLSHRDEFSAMLSQLNGTETPPAEEENIPVKSLEARSKTSKSRVHYHKFTRGKDLSRYSAQDMACILGKKANDSSQARTKDESEDEDEGISSETEKSHGVVTIQKGSIQDYFAAKMAALKQKAKNVETLAPVDDTNETVDSNEVADSNEVTNWYEEDVQPMEETEKKSKSERRVHFNEHLTDVKEFVSYKEEKAARKREKSLKKKRKDSQENGEAVLLESFAETEMEMERVEQEAAAAVMEAVEITKKKKRKKDKKLEGDSQDVDVTACVEAPVVDVIEEKKRKKKLKVEGTAVVLEEVAAESKEEAVPKEKKKKKKKEKETKDGVESETGKDAIAQEISSAAVEVSAETTQEQTETETVKVKTSNAEKKRKHKQMKREAKEKEEAQPIDETKQMDVTKNSKKGKKRKHEDVDGSSEKKAKTEAQTGETTADAKYATAPNFSYLLNSVKPELIHKVSAKYKFADFEKFQGSNLYAVVGYGH